MKESDIIKGKPIIGNNYYASKEQKKPFFKGYKPTYYFRNLTNEEAYANEKTRNILSEPIGIKLFNRKEGD